MVHIFWAILIIGFFFYINLQLVKKLSKEDYDILYFMFMLVYFTKLEEVENDTTRHMVL
jgi:uncharacterized membrane protein YesL